jgi:hypothetical protein
MGGLSTGRTTGTGGLNTGRTTGTGGLQGSSTDKSNEMATPEDPNVSATPNLRPLPQFQQPLPNQQALTSQSEAMTGSGASATNGTGTATNSGIEAGTEADKSVTGTRR